MCIRDSCQLLTTTSDFGVKQNLLRWRNSGSKLFNMEYVYCYKQPLIRNSFWYFLIWSTSRFLTFFHCSLYNLSCICVLTFVAYMWSAVLFTISHGHIENVFVYILTCITVSRPMLQTVKFWINRLVSFFFKLVR